MLKFRKWTLAFFRIFILSLILLSFSTVFLLLLLHFSVCFHFTPQTTYISLLISKIWQLHRHIPAARPLGRKITTILRIDMLRHTHKLMYCEDLAHSWKIFYRQKNYILCTGQSYICYWPWKQESEVIGFMEAEFLKWEILIQQNITCSCNIFYCWCSLWKDKE